MKYLPAGVLVGLLGLGLSASVSAGEEGIGFRTDIFLRHKDGYHTYRIPTMVVTTKGTVLLFCEGRKNSRRDGGDIDMLLKRSEDGGRTWSEQMVLLDEGGGRVGNSCAIVERIIERKAKEPERPGRVLAELDGFLMKGDHVGALAWATKAAGDDKYAEVAKEIASSVGVCKAIGARQRAAVEGARARTGQKVRLAGRLGRPRKGEVKAVTQKGIDLVTKFVISGGGKRVEGEKRVTVVWADLALDQVDELAREGGGKDTGADAAVARAYLALGRKKADVAEKALERATDHPLAAHVKDLVEESRKPPEKAAPKTGMAAKREPAVPARGVVHLLFTRGRGECLFYTKSTDDGKTWSEFVTTSDVKGQKEYTEKNFLQGFGGSPVKVGAGPVHGIQTKKGRLIAPSYVGRMVESKRRGGSCIIYSDDGGKTWAAGGVIPFVEELRHGECTVVERSDGSLLMNMRTSAPGLYALGHRAVSTSTDGGATWSKPVLDMNLPEPACQASMIRLNEKEILFLNPAVHRKGGFHLWSRHDLTLRLSRDDGRTWPHSRILRKRLAGYSDMAITKEGKILCVYENGERDYCERISIAQVDRAWLLAGKAPQ